MISLPSFSRVPGQWMGSVFSGVRATGALACWIASDVCTLGLMRAAQRFANLQNLIAHMYSCVLFRDRKVGVRLECLGWRLKILATAGCAIRVPLISQSGVNGLIHQVMLSRAIFRDDAVAPPSLAMLKPCLCVVITDLQREI